MREINELIRNMGYAVKLLTSQRSTFRYASASNKCNQ